MTGNFFSSAITFGNEVLTNSNGNSNFFIAKLDTTLTTGISQPLHSSNSIKIYPNPSTGAFCFSGAPTNAIIQIYNVLGEMVYSDITNSTNSWVSLNNEAKGIYFYRVSEPEHNIAALQQGKIVLQ